MTGLGHYLKDANSSILSDNGAFFAFSDSQLDKSKKEGVKYVSLGAGLIAPKDKAAQLIEQLGEARKEAIKSYMRDHSREDIIKRELSNYEAYYTGDITEVMSALEGFGITTEEVFRVYKKQLPLQSF